MFQSFADKSEQNFRDNVRRYREQAAMTQAELAQRLSEEGFAFHAQTIYKIERGERQLRLTEAVAIARAVGVELEILIDDPQSNDLTDLLVRVESASEALRDSVREYEDAQSTLAMHLDHLGVTPRGEGDYYSDALTKNAMRVVSDVALRQEYSRASLKNWIEFMETNRPGELDPDTKQMLLEADERPAGPFSTIWKESRGEHQEEA